jgi:hypothetical protein
MVNTTRNSSKREKSPMIYLVLNETPEGREMIRLYYEWSTALVKAMEGNEEFKEEVKEMIGGLLQLVIEEVE